MTIQADIFAEQEGLFQPQTSSRAAPMWHYAKFVLSGQLGDDASLCNRWKADAGWNLDVDRPPTPDVICRVCTGIKDGTWHPHRPR